MYKFGWESAAQKGVYQQIISLSPTSVSSLLSHLPWNSKKCGGIQLSHFISLGGCHRTSRDLPSVSKQCGDFSKQPVYLQVVAISSHWTRLLIFPSKNPDDREPWAFQGGTGYHMTAQAAKPSVTVTWLTPASLTDLNIITLGLPTTLWLKKCSPPKRTLGSLRFSWGKNFESPRLLYFPLIISLVLWASWNFGQ